MSKEDDIKFMKIQTCVLKVNIHCDGCKQKVKKLLQKVDGVFQINIDAEQGRVTVSGDVDPAALVKKLNKAGKYSEILHQKGASNNNQIQKLQPDNSKAQQNKDNGKPPKGGVSAGAGGGGKVQKGQPTLMPSLQQMKGFKDLKLPFKDLKLPFHKEPKSVKFALPPEAGEDGSDYDDFDEDDDDDFDDDDLDEFDSFDADFDDDFRNLKLKPGSVQPNAANCIQMPDKKNGKKGGGVEIPVQIKGMNGNNDPKSGKKGGANQSQGGGGKNSGKPGGGGGALQDDKSAGTNGNSKPNPGKKGAAGGPGSGAGGGAGGKHGSSSATVGAPFRPPASFPPGMNVGQMGPMPQIGHTAGTVQGLPPGMVPPGYFPANGMPAMTPEMMAAASAAAGGGGPGSAYQQQYMAALMQQQQQQRMMMMNGQDRGYPPMMGYPRPPPPAMYMPPPQPYGEPYTNYFSDENANSCSIM